ncbi:DUF6434 domain-containing protein [Xanthomonas sacchari]|uniref:DUF6434 domain-containing protein n=1 Tax=Xanthomonas sacchari TaxID=56458 RepID=A0A2P5Z5U3_9XANT|nr:DUF6434 domain-containing protein [Xanthomonas sacchari]MDV0437883.1 DUF6434 domain-containing protein [Xanthomonas sacchari]PPU83439.1 hypothetical protein XsacCFBP4641_06700 [Xanthomonas sacchari]
MRDTHEDTTSASKRMHFDWHSDTITRATPVDGRYRNTQNVRRFLVAACGDRFVFDRAFMAWIRNGVAKTMVDVADEWRRQHTGAAAPDVTSPVAHAAGDGSATAK